MAEQVKTVKVKEWNSLQRKVRQLEQMMVQSSIERERILEHLDVLGKTLLIPSGKRLGS